MTHPHMDDMNGMEGMAPEPTSNGTMMMHNQNMMHMTFFWGKDAVVLFDNWPAGKSGMYALSLIFVFVMSVLVEVLSRTRFIKPESNTAVAGMVRTLVHVLRVGLSYLVMLALMSFNGGIFLVAVLGHGVGFLLCRSRVVKKQYRIEDVDLSPALC